MKHFAQYLDRHDYPAIFYRFPFIVRMVYTVNFILTLRNWYVRRALRKLEKQQHAEFSFLDAGSGMGEFSLGVAKRNPNSRVVGMDYLESNGKLASRIAQSMNLRNTKFSQVDLTKINISLQYNMILCNSALQFIKDDEKALQQIHEALKLTGVMLLYVPITYRRYFPWSELFERKYLSDFFYKYHDDFLMHRYTADEVVKKIQQQGFMIRSSEYTYGICGAIAFELYSMMLAAVKQLPAIVSIPCVLIYACVIFPVQLMLMAVDFFLPQSKGNGLLIVAEKQGNSTQGMTLNHGFVFMS
jgi:2-polyprenyl-3-methyl-5-hydroxy-6-metoxy-1,4-benzoquinol methylase